jgi:hypothetical protein
MLPLIAFAAVAEQPSHCLNDLARHGHQIVMPYDRAHDAKGQNASFSCSLGLTASEVRSDLQRILSVAHEPGCAGLRGVLLIPFTIEHAGRVSNATAQNVCLYARQIKSALLKSEGTMTATNLELAGWRGAFFNGGEIWLNTVRSGKTRPMLRLISLGSSEPFPRGVSTAAQVPPTVVH